MNSCAHKEAVCVIGDYWSCSICDKYSGLISKCGVVKQPSTWTRGGCVIDDHICLRPAVSIFVHLEKQKAFQRCERHAWSDEKVLLDNGFIRVNKLA